VSLFKNNVSIVIPVLDEQESIVELYNWIKKVLETSNLHAELIFVDDGSIDDSWMEISKLAIIDNRVRGLRFTRNYGKSAALHAGFQICTGDVVITMDADLQDSPDEIPKLHRMITEEGYHMVSGWKKIRHDPLEKRIPSKFFNWVTRIFSGIKLHDFNCGLKAYQNRVVKSINVYGERHRYIPLLVKWSGYKKITETVVVHQARKYGVTKFGFERYITGFLDLLSVSFITRFRKNPMHFFGLLGIMSFMSGFGITLFLVVDKILNQYYRLPTRDVVDQPIFFLALVALIIGVQLFLSGFLAEMVIQSSPNKHDYQIEEEIKLNA
jgi:glycosyltransferase involved in cell wall biosynthesis